MAGTGGDHLRDALGATQLNATASAGVAGTFVYAPASGTLLAAGAGQTLSVTFTPDDTATYDIATATVTIDVLKATPVITWPTPAAITYGTTLGGDAVERDRAGGRGGHVCLYAVERRGAGAGAGQTLSVTFTPTNTADYNAATATVDDHGAEGDAGDHLADAGGDHLWDRAQWHAAERDRAGGCCGHVGVYAGERRVLARARARHYR